MTNMNWQESPEVSFELALAAFDGAAEDFLYFEARKVFTIVTATTGADTTIDRDGMSVLWPHRREPFRYFPVLGPSVVAALRAHAPGGSFDSAFDLDPQALAPLCIFEHPSPMRFWVSRSSDRITILCRPATAENAAASIPLPLVPWSLPPKVFATFEAPRRCVHCSVFPDRFRVSDDVLICLACGRSQQIEPEELERATLQSAPPSGGR